MYLLKSHEEEVLKSEIKIVQVWSTLLLDDTYSLLA